MFRECPAFSSWDVSGGHRGLDLPPSPVRRKTDHGIPNPGTGAAGLAGRVGIGRRTDRYSPSGGRIPRQRSRAVTPLADRLGPLIPPSLEPVPNCAARVGSGEHGHDGGDAQFGQPVRMRGVVGRQVDREAGLDGRSEQTPVLDSGGVVAKDGLVGVGLISFGMLLTPAASPAAAEEARAGLSRLRRPFRIPAGPARSVGPVRRQPWFSSS